MDFIPTNDMTETEALAALPGLSEAELISAACSNPHLSVRREAVRLISSPEALFGIARRLPENYEALSQKRLQKEAELRLMAVEKLTDEDMLMDIIRNEHEWFIRHTAAERLKEQKNLIFVAENDENPFVRRVALKEVCDQDVLQNIAANDSDILNRALAVSMLTSPEALFITASGDSNWFVRSAAADRISDEIMLRRIVLGDPDYHVRRSAAIRIRNASLLTDLAQSDSSPEVRAAANQTLMRLRDEEFENELRYLREHGLKESSLRLQYEKQVCLLQDFAAELKTIGLPEEDVARRLHEKRRELGREYKEAAPPLFRQYILDATAQKYGDPFGPTFEQLRAQKTYSQIIESASRPIKDLNDRLTIDGFIQWYKQQND